MLREQKIKKKWKDKKGNRDILDSFEYYSDVSKEKILIKESKVKRIIENEEYFVAEFEAGESTDIYRISGTYLAFNLNDVDLKRYFGETFTCGLYDKSEFLNGIISVINHQEKLLKRCDITVEKEGYLKVVLIDEQIDDTVIELIASILRYIREYYDKQGIHITRMFGSYILLKKIDGQLSAIKATPIPIKYCPLMIKLLREVGGEVADRLIASLTSVDEKEQTEMMCELINEVVIKGGYFDTSRPLNSCEANVLFGASETMSSAFKTGLIDSAVIVSNNLGTIITTNEFNTQGAVKRMTGLFHTSPNEEIVNTAIQEGIIPVYPYTATINQLEGVKKAISLGYKRIAVSVASHDNYLHEQLAELEKEYGITIYKFGLCSTGIDRDTALKMQEQADVIWSCASKHVKELVEPNALAQVGIKIPVHIMTKQGWDIVRNHLLFMNSQNNLNDVELQSGDEKPVLLNSEGKIKVLKKKQIHNCSDCPHPCV